MSKATYSLGRQCGCGKIICDKGKTGMCKSCHARFVSSDPASSAKRAASVALYAKQNPGAMRERARRAGATKRANPEMLETLRRQMRAIQLLSYTPEAMARRDPADRGRKATRTKLAWCPAEYINEYLWLCKSKCLSTKDAKAIILEQVAAVEARLSPFERQERALAQGGKLIANDAAPSPYAAQAKWNVG